MNSTTRKIEPINRLLESRYGIRVDSNDADHLVLVMNHYDDRRKLFIRTMGETAYQNSEYRKSYLISEAARILLREIAPKRIKKRKKQ